MRTKGIIMKVIRTIMVIIITKTTINNQAYSTGRETISIGRAKVT